MPFKLKLEALIFLKKKVGKSSGFMNFLKPFQNGFSHAGLLLLGYEQYVGLLQNRSLLFGLHCLTREL